MKKRTLFLLLCSSLAFIFVSSTVMTTYAAWSVQNDTTNQVSMGSVQVKLLEEYEQGQSLMPGITADKKVWAKNTGELDIVVRMKITKAWGTPGPNDKFVKDPSLSTDNILIPYNKEHWLYNENDDFYYYKGVLAPGEVTPALFEKFTLTLENSNDYRNKHANITVTVECVQAQGGGISIWDMSFEKLGVVYKEPTQPGIVARVNFVSPGAGFSFPDNNGDLFAAFKLLAPGGTRTQAVQVINQWNEPVEIFLWAAVTEQTLAKPEDMALVNQLLREYSYLTVTEGAAKLYEGSVWGNPTLDSTGTDSMRYPRSLGVFQPGAGKTLKLDLKLDERMDNKFRDLAGLVDWYFSAAGSNGAEPTTKPGDTTTTTTGIPSQPQPPPKTGSSQVTFWATLAVASGALMIAAIIAMRRETREERHA